MVTKKQIELKVIEIMCKTSFEESNYIDICAKDIAESIHKLYQIEIDQLKTKNENLKKEITEKQKWDSKGIHPDKDGSYPTRMEYQRQQNRCRRLKDMRQEKNFNKLLDQCSEFEKRFL